MSLKVFFLALGVLLLGVLCRVWLGSALEYRVATKLYEKNDTRSAIYAYGKSIRWYTPLNPWVKKSVHRLKNISQKQENLELSLLALSEIRHGLYSVRSFYQPYESELDEVNKHISKLRHQIQLESGGQLQVNLNYYLKAYRVEKKPFPYALLLFHTFFWTWLFNIVWGISRSFSESDVFLFHKSKIHILYFMASLMGWTFCLTKVVIN